MKRVLAFLPAALIGFFALVGPLLAPHGADDIVTGPFARPAAGSPLGGDELGRDVLSRLLDGGFGLAVSAAVISVLVTALAAVLGSLAALEGPLAKVVGLVTDILVLVPPLLVAMLVLLRLNDRSAWGSLGALVLVAVLAGTPYSARVFAGAASVIARTGYVEVALANRVGHRRVVFEEILPNLRATLVTQLALRFVESTALLSTVAFLRLPAALGVSNWAAMVRDSVGPGLVLNPAAAIAPACAIVALSLAVRHAIMAFAPTEDESRAGAVSAIGLTPASGKLIAVLGASGAGKTTTLLRLVSPPVLVGEKLRVFRRTRISFVGQDPGSELTPTMRARKLIAETARRPERLDELASRVGLTEEHLRKRPGQLSGGEQRRVALLRGVLRENPVLVVDEPFAGLDGVARDAVAELLRELADKGTAVVVSGHDEATLSALADDVVVVGEEVVVGGEEVVVGGEEVVVGGEETASPITRTGQPHCGHQVVFAVHNLTLRLPNGRMLVEDGEFELASGSLTGLTGDSGAGKTTLARALVGLAPVISGVFTRPRPQAVQLVPQNPAGTLNPRRTVRQTLRGAARDADVTSLLREVGLDPAFADRLPGELSGGERQRVAFARALAPKPAVLICDEVTSALDARTAESIMRTIGELAAREGLAALVISHDLDLVDRHCHQVLALGDGALRAR